MARSNFDNIEKACKIVTDNVTSLISAHTDLDIVYKQFLI